MGHAGTGGRAAERDPALADFPERSPHTRRRTFADRLGPHFLDAPDQPVPLIESKAVFARRRFHRQADAHVRRGPGRRGRAGVGVRSHHVEQP
jgi:deoxyribodipyrimidine photolyase-related protein